MLYSKWVYNGRSVTQEIIREVRAKKVLVLLYLHTHRPFSLSSLDSIWYHIKQQIMREKDIEHFEIIYLIIIYHYIAANKVL